MYVEQLFVASIDSLALADPRTGMDANSSLDMGSRKNEMWSIFLDRLFTAAYRLFTAADRLFTAARTSALETLERNEDVLPFMVTLLEEMVCFVVVVAASFLPL